MSKAGIRALKQNASALVAKAASGEAVTITDRGRPVALIVPITSSRVETLISADLARPALRRLSDLPAPSRIRRRGSTASEVLKEMRQTERS